MLGFYCVWLGFLLLTHLRSTMSILHVTKKVGTPITTNHDLKEFINNTTVVSLELFLIGPVDPEEYLFTRDKI